jgi:hypothetical protein
VAELTTNFAASTVATAPSPATSGTSLTVASGHGTRFPDPAVANFNCVVVPANADPTPENAEIVRVTGKSTDTFTITRTQEGTSARSIQLGDRIYATITARTLNTEFYSAGQVDFIAGAKRNQVNTVTTYLPLPLNVGISGMAGTTTNPFSNNNPGYTLTQTGFSVISTGIVIPSDAVSNNMKIRAAVGATSGGDIRVSGELKKVADGAALTGGNTTAASTVTLTANNVKMIDLSISVSATAGNHLAVRFYRDGDNAADTLAASAYLMALSLVYDATI